MDDKEQKRAAQKFVEFWKGKGYEKGQTQAFWLSLLREVFGVKEPEKVISFEDQVVLKNTNFIDAYIPATRVLIEQKGSHIDLTQKIKQSDGSMLTPFQQARRYISGLSFSTYPRWIIVCNFSEFHVHDMERPDAPPETISLESLPDEVYRLNFLVQDQQEVLAKEKELSVAAGNLVGLLYDELLKGYKDPSSKESQHSLNVLCVRLVFCLYAEDAGIFGRRMMFHDYLARYKDRPSDVRAAILRLFEVFDTPVEKRDPYGDEELAAFPYVNGSLFANAKAQAIPAFTPEIVSMLLNEASEGFDWSKISPTIFGAVFESTLNPETRRKGGMHYTSIENIHKVIDPLFLNDLKDELAQIRSIKTLNTKADRLRAFHDKLASLTFFDPACGSGNFLTETYLSLRRLENEVIRIQSKGQASFNIEGLSPTKISLSQFYGIEINDFACAVAKTALWIAESQMLNETEDILGVSLPFFPLKTLTNIIEGNALRIDWKKSVSEKVSYIFGNPPFIWHQHRTSQQTEDMDCVFAGMKNYGKIDYVGAWFKKASDYISGTDTAVSFVSTNSLFQGESVPCLWDKLLEPNGNIAFSFAYEPFSWSSEAKDSAVVSCVITGFTDKGCVNKERRIYLNDGVLSAKNINGYLTDAPNVCIASRSAGVSDGRPKIVKGSQPTDGGYLFLSEEERNEFVEKYPKLNHLVKRFLGADEFINDLPRYCFWLHNVKPAEYIKNQYIKSRLEKVAEVRKASPTASVQEDASTPYLFTQIRQPENDYLLIPRHTGENRKYIPIGFIDKDVICGDANYLIEKAELELFALLTSSVHMAWLKTICGRLEMRYRYSPSVYNSFVFPKMSDCDVEHLRKSGKKILEARSSSTDSTLFDLYNPLSMPKELIKAHKENDKLVLKLYGLKDDATESEIVGFLMTLYVNKIKENEKVAAVDTIVQKIIGKKADTVPDWMKELRQQCLDGTITPDDLITQGKVRLKEEKKKAKEAEKETAKATKQ